MNNDDKRQLMDLKISMNNLTTKPVEVSDLFKALQGEVDKAFKGRGRILARLDMQLEVDGNLVGLEVVKLVKGQIADHLCVDVENLRDLK